MRVLLAVIAMLAACRDGGGAAGPPPPEPAPRPGDAAPTTPPSTADAGPRMEGGFFLAAGAPPPLACAKDDDCTVNSTRGENGCCLAGVWVPQSVAYSRWMAAWREKKCAAVKCPPVPAPYPPEECRTQARCAEGRCTDRCGTSPGR
jgi:hypothetical protein